MITRAHIAGLVTNRVLAIHPDKLPLILDVIQGRIPFDVDERWVQDAHARVETMPEDARKVMKGPARAKTQNSHHAKPYQIIDGVAVIPVLGSLVNRGAWIGAYSVLTSYDGLKHQIKHAVADSDAHSIVLDIDSPGGEAVGAFEIAEVIRAGAAQKRIIAVVNGMAASAAYAIASAATKIVTTKSGMSGSIGVVMMHADYSRKLDEAGIVPTLIFAGARKVDGNPYQPLPDLVRKELQMEIDKFYGMFVESVAAGRKQLSAKAIRATEAATYVGSDAIRVGLADEIGSMETVLQNLEPKIQKAPAVTVYTQLDVDRARAEGRAAGLEESITDGGMEAAQARLRGILSLPEAQGRERSAQQLALTGKVSIEAAKQILMVTPIDTQNERSGASAFGLVFSQC